MSTIRATYVQHGSSSVPNITLNASGQVIVASGIVSSGTFAAPTGSASAPGVYFVGDTNTGIYSPGADQVAISTNGTGRFFIDSSGRVGVGVASPATPLHVRASNTTVRTTAASSDFTAFEAAIDSGATCRIGAYVGLNGFVGTTTNHPLVFETNSAERLRITSDGKLGLGTSSPSQLLHVNGSGLANNWLVPSTTGYFYDSTGQNGIYIYGSTNGTTPNILTLNTNGTERLRVDASGRVGVGTTSPDQALTVQGVLALKDSSGAGVGQLGSIGSTFRIQGQSGANLPLTLWTSDTERARIDTSGRLLVGTTSAPTGTQSQYSKYVLQGNTFDANGPARMAIRVGAAASALSSGSAIADIYFVDNGAGEYARIACEADAQAGSGDYPGRLVFSTTADGASSPTERVRITSTGQVRLAGAGITFNGDTATANELDDYEEGTFTPTYHGTGGSAGSAAYTANGRYTKIGNLVTVFADVTLSDKGSWTGTAVFGGLPFAAATGRQNLGSCWMARTAVAAQTFYQARVGPSESSVSFPKISNNGVDAYLDIADLANDSTIRYTLTYAV